MTFVRWTGGRRTGSATEGGPLRGLSRNVSRETPRKDGGAFGFGIYIHWPYCTSKCPYCDFNSHVASSIDPKRWMTAYREELSRAATETSDRTVETVFFGGGTPSLMEPEIVGEALATIQRHWRVANDWEVTLEANPGSVEAGRFAAYRAAGVNRVSLGVQSLDDAALARLGRRTPRRGARGLRDRTYNVCAGQLRSDLCATGAEP